MSLAIFDLDNTLLAGDSDHSWGEFIISKKIVDAATYKLRNDKFYADYQNGSLDIFAYQEFVLQPLAGFTLEELAALHNEFMETTVAPMMLPKAAELVESHRAKGDTLLIITATNRFVTEPIAKKLRIDNLLATEPEMINRRYTGKIIDIPCFQQGKVQRLEKWLNEHAMSLDGAWFYSDSANDIPLLEVVDHPVAVDPDEKLKKVALEKDWPIISLR